MGQVATHVPQPMQVSVFIDSTGILLFLDKVIGFLLSLNQCH